MSPRQRDGRDCGRAARAAKAKGRECAPPAIEGVENVLTFSMQKKR
jgi:hypothetical protein